MTLTRIFIVLESESHGLSKNCNGISRKARKFKLFFCPKTGDLQKKGLHRNWETFFRPKNRWSPKKEKKRSSPKLRLIFRLNSEIQSLFQAESRHVFHNFGTQFPLQGGGLFSIFHQSASKAPKTCDFAYFTSQWGGARAPPPSLATLLVTLKCLIWFESWTFSFIDKSAVAQPISK